MKHSRLWKALFLSAVMLTSFMLPFRSVSDSALTAAAVSADYPAQLMNIAAKDGSTVLTETGTADGSAITMQKLGNNLAPSWRFDRVNTDTKGTFFKIINAQSGRALTPQNYKASAGANVIVYGSESHQTQHWYAIPEKNDRLGNGLYYKIVNYADTSLALTAGANGMTLASYTGADNQLFLLNADGLQGFAGYCGNDQTGNIKAADIGGLFGEVVEAGDFNTLKKYATADQPYTIVVTKNIAVYDLNLNGQRYMCTNGRIYVKNNKTIIGSYGAHTLNNVQFCTAAKNGVGNNIIIKNFDMQHDAESNHNDSIVCYFGSGENIWVDHVTFTGHNNYGYAPKTQQVDEDKFLACCYDADYCTISDCSFGAHKYGLILGYPADGADSKQKYNNFPRMSLISNKFNDTNTRGPGLMRWGYFHSLNNYVNKFNMAYTVISECKIFAENCVYENGGNVICDWDKVNFIGYYAESGSIFNNCKRTKVGGDSNSTAQNCNWRPSGNYNYTSLQAANVKNYCNSFSGCQQNAGNVMYLRYGAKGVPSAGYNEAPNGSFGETVTPAEFTDGAAFRIKNANSGLYMQIEGGKAENGANIQQWGTDGASLHDIWRLYSAGDGYYYIATALTEGSDFVLDVAGKKTDNGTNIDLYQNNGGANQQFMLTDNGDGTYKIRTRISEGKSAVEIINADKTAGANVQQWEINDESCQNWALIPTAVPMNGKLIKGVSVGDTDHAASYSIAYDTKQGDTIFGDREFTFSTLPDILNGTERIVTACDSKTFAGEQLTFTAAYDITVYVAIDTRLGSPQAWLSDYTATGENIQTSNEVTLAVYEKPYAAGEQITLGSNGSSTNCINYAVFAGGRLAQKPLGDINADGSTDKNDLLLLQNWLLTGKSAAQADWQAADLDGNGKLNAADLTLLKALLMK